MCTTYENMRHIKNVISETNIRNPLSIQPEAWKLLVETFGRPAMQEYVEKRKAKEQVEQEKQSTTTPVSQKLTDLITIPPNQYISNNTARANTAQVQEKDDNESSEKEDKRKVYPSLQKFCNEHFAKITTNVHAGTTTLQLD